MLITRWIDYGVRIMLALALAPDAWHSAEELARSCDITRPATLRIIRQLARAGFVETRRGPGGGVHLAIEPQALSFQDIILATDRRRAVNPCLVESDFCGRAERCAVHRLLEPLQKQVDSFFTTLTLADLVAAHHRIDDEE